MSRLGVGARGGPGHRLHATAMRGAQGGRGTLLAPGRIPRASGAAAAFRRHRDVTPAEYARRACRERAHRELQATDPDGRDTVAVIAARWSFVDTGRFATASARTYDEPLVTTLRG